MYFLSPRVNLSPFRSLPLAAPNLHLHQPFGSTHPLRSLSSLEEFFWCLSTVFDLISFSSGLNMFGLFEDSCNPADDRERFILAKPLEKIVEKVEEFAKANENNSRVRWKKKWDVELEGRNCNVAIGVDVYQLTDGLVVVEAKRNGGDAGSYKDMWKNKLRPQLISGQTSQP